MIFDADDTLWENNVLFERVIDDFLRWMAHPTRDLTEMRAVLDEIEAANAVTHGYGAKVLLRSLHDCFERLSERPADPAERTAINELAGALSRNEVELIRDVSTTLEILADRYQLMLLTKGDKEEQQRKLDASKLGRHFEHIHIVPEKNVDTYLALIDRHGLRTELTWMIGNSPRSDIRPARAAGLNAVFIPHEHTWVLEQDDIDATDDRVLVLTGFAELLEHF
ncbi:HAD family hydrolase [Rugosimonospora acidiphila]|uniref:HAD family hydrolase n=1 Tax=Rugosimonospora acidiphila TaxID=556531 RepID=A0ABP9RVF1_9ACTN